MHARVHRRRYSKPVQPRTLSIRLNAGAPGGPETDCRNVGTLPKLIRSPTGACPASAGSYLPAATSITERRTDYLYPELNLIEIVWKHFKYHWRRFVTWTTQTIDTELAELLGGYGTRFQVNFS